MYTEKDILAYLQKRMTATETADFEGAVMQSPELKETLEDMTLMYLLHEHPDSPYSTTTPVSEDTRDFVNNLFDEIDNEPTPPPMPADEISINWKPFAIAAAALFALIIALFWYFSNPNNEQKSAPVNKDTISTKLKEDTGKVSVIKDKPSNVASKPSKPLVPTINPTSEKDEAARFGEKVQIIFDQNWALEKDIVQLQTNLDICKNNAGAASASNAPNRKLVNTQDIDQLKELFAAASDEQIQLKATKADFEILFEKCKNKKK